MSSSASTLTHSDIDRRIRRLVEACVRKIEGDPTLLLRARAQWERWAESRLKKDWEGLLAMPWPELRSILLESSERGDRIRQSVPFGGFLGNEERMRILKVT